jgi:hypothetical protein
MVDPFVSTDPELIRLLAEAVAKVKAMSPAEQEAMFKAQRESVVRAEMSWPKSNYKWINGVKVYDSLDDYYND